jgi:hypothetical protein
MNWDTNGLALVLEVTADVSLNPTIAIGGETITSLYFELLDTVDKSSDSLLE